MLNEAKTVVGVPTTDESQPVLIMGKTSYRTDKTRFTKEGENFVNKFVYFNKLHFVTIIGNRNIGKTALINKLFGKGNQI